MPYEGVRISNILHDYKGSTNVINKTCKWFELHDLERIKKNCITFKQKYKCPCLKCQPQCLFPAGNVLSIFSACVRATIFQLYAKWLCDQGATFL